MTTNEIGVHDEKKIRANAGNLVIPVTICLTFMRKIEFPKLSHGFEPLLPILKVQNYNTFYVKLSV